MTRQEFAAVVRHLCDYFGQAEPPPGQMEAWFGVLEGFAGGAYLDMAVGELKLNEAYFPKNLPRALIAHLPQPRPRPRQSVPCDFCRGTGILHARKLGQDGRPVSHLADYSFRCGHCRQSPLVGIPLALRTGLPGLGFLPCD